jgi:hypothetical protein
MTDRTWQKGDVLAPPPDLRNYRVAVVERIENSLREGAVLWCWWLDRRGWWSDRPLYYPARKFSRKYTRPNEIKASLVRELIAREAGVKRDD